MTDPAFSTAQGAATAAPGAAPNMALLTDRSLLRLDGADALHFLQGLVTQDMTRLAEKGILYGALLTPQGKLSVDLLIVNAAADGGTSVLLDCPRSAAAGLQQKLALYRLRAAIEITDLGDDYAVLAGWDAEAPATPARPGPRHQEGGVLSFQDPRSPRLGERSYIPRAEPMPALTAVTADYQQHLAREGVPQFGTDMMGGDVFPLDINLDALNGIDFQKGCFVGQEVTSRMKRKGAVRKRLYRAEFEGEAPAPGTDVKTAGAAGIRVGTLRSSSGKIALVLVRTDKIPGQSSFVAATGEKLRTLGPPAYLEGI